MAPMEHTEAIRAAAATVAVLLIPGRALFLACRLDRNFEGLQGWLVALGIGAALPVLIFSAHDALVSIGVPIGGLGPWSARALVGLGAVVLLERWWRGAPQRALARDEWFAVGIILLVLAPRIWLAAKFPIPPLTDSLHHAMLTREVVESGFLPDWMPVFPSIALDRYHTGLYSITSFVTWTGSVSPLLGLIWSGQLLNAMAAIGVYIVLDRYASRKAAWVGLLCAGLINQMPNAYFAWGRFTQVGSQAILPVAWAVSWVWLRQLHADPAQRSRLSNWTLGLCSIALGVAAVLVHLRVGVFLVAILAVTFLAECITARREGRLRALVMPSLGLAVVGLLALLPRYGQGLYNWVWGHWYLSLDGKGWSGGEDLRGVNSDAYFSIWMGESIFSWVGPPLLVVAALGLGLLAIIRGNQLARVTAAWCAVLLALGSVHLFRIHVLDVLPMNAVLIFSYFPLAILLGAGSHMLSQAVPAERTGGVEKMIAIGALILAVVSLPARFGDVPPEYNLVEDGDRKAFAWIRDNTPLNAQFAIAAYAHLPSLTVGTDGGYWIPYFTGRRTTTGPMLSPLSPRLMTRASQLVKVQKLPGFSPDKVHRLISHGVEYFYFSRSAWGLIDGRKLAKSPLISLVYDRDGVQIIKMTASPQFREGIRLLQENAAAERRRDAGAPVR